MFIVYAVKYEVVNCTSGRSAAKSLKNVGGISQLLASGGHTVDMFACDTERNINTSFAAHEVGGHDIQ